VFPPFFLIAGVFALVVTLIRRNPRLTIVLVCPLWIAAAALWWGADLSNWWGPEPEAGLLVYAVLGSLMVLARFRSAVRSGNGLA
jgi:hypothetical protein